MSTVTCGSLSEHCEWLSLNADQIN